jgi:hypothetical protein
MALMKCPDCAREVSDQAGVCPGCGCPINPVEKSGTAEPPAAAAPEDRKKGGCLKGVLAVVVTAALIGVGLFWEKKFPGADIVAPTGEVRISASKEEEYVARMGRERYETEMEKIRQIPRLTVVQLIRFFEANEIAADKQYKDQEVILIGLAADISKSVLGVPKITLRGDGKQKTLVASLKRKEEEAAAAVSKGAAVTLKGVVTRSVLGKVGLKQATVFDENDPLAGNESAGP